MAETRFPEEKRHKAKEEKKGKIRKKKEKKKKKKEEVERIPGCTRGSPSIADETEIGLRLQLEAKPYLLAAALGSPSRDRQSPALGQPWHQQPGTEHPGVRQLPVMSSPPSTCALVGKPTPHLCSSIPSPFHPHSGHFPPQ